MELRVRRDDLTSCELADGESPGDELEEGEAQLVIERFALSSNNVTYAVLGDRIGYWRLFPADEGWGRIPAWGYGRVIASRSPALVEGQRMFGLFPMGAYLTVRPAPHPLGFLDMAPHRAELSPVYNLYLSVSVDDEDDRALVMRPLFTASVLVDLMLSEADFNGAGTVVVTSASSKTAYGLAHLLRERSVRTTGLTSSPRREWVEGLGLYDSVLTYDELDALGAPDGAVLVDLSGDRSLVRRVHERLSDELVRSVLVGFTHWEAEGDEEPPPGPAPEIFFAPDEMVRRGREFGRRFSAAWESFAPVAERTMRIERISEGDALVRLYGDLLHGRADPAAGYVASLSERA
jgi:Protein of unknown function (DUF2855)